MKVKWAMCSAIFGTILIAVAIGAKLSGFNETETWSKMNFVCSGYDNSGSRCEFVSPPNIKDNADRFYFYCQEHYSQFPSDWIENERDVFLKIEEPSEPECSHGNFYGISQGMGESDTYCGLCGEILKTYELGEPDAVLHYQEPKPEPTKYSLPIPTWPDYIELEKDLIIEEPADICEIAGREHDFSVRIELAKGTKIYFKE